MGGIIHTDKNWRNGALPRLEGENPDVFPGSPLAVIGLWVFALRERFSYSEDNQIPWAYSSDLQPLVSENADPLPDGSPRKLDIQATYNVDKAQRNYRPAIYVGRSGGPLTAEKLSVDNRAGVRLPDNYRAYHCHGTMPVVFECRSESGGASSAIGETAWAFILSSRDVFRKDFGLHEITEPILSDTLQDEVDKEIWVTNVQFSVTYDLRWGVVPIAPRLRETALRTGLRNNPNFFVDIALRDGEDS